jgi:hypothetical protein
MLSFRRNLGERKEMEFAELLDILEGLQLSDSEDAVKWTFEKMGSFLPLLCITNLLSLDHNIWLLCF